MVFRTRQKHMKWICSKTFTAGISMKMYLSLLAVALFQGVSICLLQQTPLKIHCFHQSPNINYNTCTIDGILIFIYIKQVVKFFFQCVVIFVTGRKQSNCSSHALSSFCVNCDNQLQQLWIVTRSIQFYWTLSIQYIQQYTYLPHC